MAGRCPETGQQKTPICEFLRLAIPRRVYTKSHLDVVLAGFRRILARTSSIRGLEFVDEPEVLRHLTCAMKPVLEYTGLDNNCRKAG